MAKVGPIEVKVQLEPSKAIEGLQMYRDALRLMEAAHKKMAEAAGQQTAAVTVCIERLLDFMGSKGHDDDDHGAGA